jgi:hypothetical protein
MSSAVQVFWDNTQRLQVNFICSPSVQKAHLLGLIDPALVGNMIPHKVGNYTE